MPKIRWGISAKDIDDFDRDSQYKPYTGPQPPNGVYQFKIKRLKSVAPTKDKLPALHVGLELVPRNKEERRFAGFFVMAFLNIGEKNQFTYVPFCDAIGVSGTDFTDRTIADQEGNVKRIGQWKMTGEELIMAQIKDGEDQKGKPRKEVGWMGPLVEFDSDDDDEEELDDDDDYYDDEDEYEYEDDEDEPF